MKNLLIILTGILLGSCSAQAQDTAFKAPDYDKIQKEIKSGDSRFHYPDLLERYQKHDTTLVHDDYRML